MGRARATATRAGSHKESVHTSVLFGEHIHLAIDLGLVGNLGLLDQTVKACFLLLRVAIFHKPGQRAVASIAPVDAQSQATPSKSLRR